MGRGSGAGSGFTSVFRPPSYQPYFEGRSRNLTFTVCNFAFILLAPFTLSNFQASDFSSRRQLCNNFYKVLFMSNKACFNYFKFQVQIVIKVGTLL